jgi:hypothetical protein
VFADCDARFLDDELCGKVSVKEVEWTFLCSCFFSRTFALIYPILAFHLRASCNLQHQQEQEHEQEETGGTFFQFHQFFSDLLIGLPILWIMVAINLIFITFEARDF